MRPVEIGDVAHQAALDQLRRPASRRGRRCRARASRRSGGSPRGSLRRAAACRCSGTPPRLPRAPPRCRRPGSASACGTRAPSPVRALRHDLDDVRDDVAGALDHDACRRCGRPCARPRPCCAARRSRSSRRRPPPARARRPGVIDAGAADRGDDVDDLASSPCCALNLKAIAQRGERDTSPRRRCRAKRVDLGDDAVDLVRQRRRARAAISRVVRDRPRRRRGRRWLQRIGLQPPGARARRGTPSGCRTPRPRSCPALWQKMSSGRVRGDARVELAQRAGGGVARVGERRLAALRARSR